MLAALDTAWKALEDASASPQADPQAPAGSRDVADAERALGEAFQLWNATVQAHPETLEVLAFGNRWHDLGVRLHELRQVVSAETALGNAVQVLETVVTRVPEDPRLKEALIHSRYQLYLLLTAAGRYEEAAALREKDVALTEQLAAEQPANAEYRQMLGWCLLSAGQCYMKLAEYTQAAAALRRCVEVRRTLLAETQDNLATQQQFVFTLVRLGHALKSCNSVKDAELAFTEAFERCAELMQQDPTVFENDLLNETGRSLAQLFDAMGRPEDAVEQLRKTVVVREGLVRSFPQDEACRAPLIQAYVELMQALRAVKSNEDAVAVGKNAATFRESWEASGVELAEESLAALASLQCGLSFVLLQTQAASEAETASQTAEQMYEKLRQKSGDSAQWQVGLATCLQIRGNALRQLGRLAEAEVALRSSVDLWKAASTGVPENWDYPARQAFAIGLLVFALQSQDKTANAIESCRTLVELRETLLEQRPQDVALRHMLAGDNDALATMLIDDPIPAPDQVQEAVECAERAVELADDDGRYWRTLGLAKFRAGQWHASRDALENAKTRGRPWSVSDWFVASMTEYQLGNRDAAIAAYEKASSLMQANPRPDDQGTKLQAESRKVLGVND